MVARAVATAAMANSTRNHDWSPSRAVIRRRNDADRLVRITAVNRTREAPQYGHKLHGGNQAVIHTPTPKARKTKPTRSRAAFALISSGMNRTAHSAPRS